MKKIINIHEINQDHTTVFRDVILLALLGFVAITLLLLPYINPPKKDDTIIDKPGNLSIEIIWPPKLDVDVDLWVEAPIGKPVGYSNKGGEIFDLLRDDLGFTGDYTDINYENSYSRGIPPGVYTVNLHLYRVRDNTPVIPVKVQVSIRKKKSEGAIRLLYTTVELTVEGEEITVFSFELDKNGNIDYNSVHNDYKPLRSPETTNPTQNFTPERDYGSIY